MKQRFNILSDPRFRLLYDEHRPFVDGPSPQTLRLNREGFTVLPHVKKKTLVRPGMLLAEHPSLEKGDLHAPIWGRVTEVTVRSIMVEAVDPQEIGEEAFPEACEPVDLLNSGLSGEDLVLAVKKLGVNTRSLGCRVKNLVVNCLNVEPGITWAEPMLEVHGSTVLAGLELLRRFHRAEEFILALPKGGADFSAPGFRTVYVEPEYPNSISPILIKKITGEELPEGWASVGLHNVWSLGRVAETGLPLMDTVITYGTASHWANYVVKNGSMVGGLLSFANEMVKSGDTVLRGGPLRGESLDKLNRSITKGAYGFFTVEAGQVPPMEGASPCINCGACIGVCPVRIDPRMLSRYAEFAKYERSRKENYELCVDCGLCGYVCIARRPVLQYIRLAIEKLRQIDAQAKLVPIEPVAKTEEPSS